MNKIVIDLEFCKTARAQRKIAQSEVIQIGAVKLDSNDQIVSRFNMLVKPEYSVIDAKVEKLTHISNSMVQEAPPFAKVFDEFLVWVGEEPFSVFSWSKDDLSVIEGECMLKNIIDPRVDMLRNNWIDLQAVFSQMIGVKRQISLGDALSAGKMVFEGQEHSALDDAENTARLYILSQDETKFNSVMKDFADIFKPKEELTYSLAGLFEGLCFE